MKRGSVTIEVMLILPFIFALIILSIDFMFITYNHARAIAEVETVRMNLCEQFAQATDQLILDGGSDLITGNISTDIQSKRGFLDAFHILLSSESVSTSFKSAVNEQQVKFKLTDVKSSYNFSLVSPSYTIDYVIEVDSPFKCVTKNFFESQRHLAGRITLPMDSNFQKMNTVEIFADRLESIDEIIDLTQTVRSVIKKWIEAL